MKLLFLLPLLIACNSETPTMESMGRIADEPAEIISQVLEASIDNLAAMGPIRSEDLIVTGACLTTGSGAVFNINVAGHSQETLCSGGRFITLVPGAVIPMGPSQVFPSIVSNGPLLAGAGSFPILKTPCDPDETLTVNGCEDSEILNASIQLLNYFTSSSKKFLSSSLAEFSIGSTQNAKWAYSFADPATCTNFKNNNCHIDPSAGACGAIPYYNSDLIANPTVIHFIGGPLNNAAPSQVTVLFVNNTKVSSCISEDVYTDTQPPVANSVLGTFITYHPNFGTVLSLNSGDEVKDYGTGVMSVEVAVGTFPNGENVKPYMYINPMDTDHLPMLPVLVENQDYFYTVRARDMFGFERISVVGPWRYVECGSGTTGTPGGGCI